MKNKFIKVLALTIVLTSLVTLLPIPLAHAEVTIENIDVASNWSSTFQRKTLVELGLQWVFYTDNADGKVYFETSADDGTTWGNKTEWRVSTHLPDHNYSLTTAEYGGNTYVYAMYDDYFQRGLLHGNSTITWDAAVDFGAHGFYQTIAVDTSGYKWIAYEDSGVVHVAKSATAYDGNFTLDTGWPQHLTTGVIWTRPSIVAATGGKMVVVWNQSSGSMCPRIKKWSGSSWSSEYTEPNYDWMINAGTFSITAQDDYVHIVYLGWSNNMRYTRYDASTHTGTADIILDTTTATSYPTISLDTDTNDLWIFWANHPTLNHLYSAYYDEGEGLWTSPIDLLLDTSGIADGRYINSHASTTSTEQGLFYVSSPTNLKFQYVPALWNIETLDPSGVTEDQATLRGNIKSVGSGTIAFRGFHFGTDSTLASYIEYGEVGNFTAGIYSYTVSDLEADSIYYVKALVEDSYGNTAEGNITAFMTAQPDYTDDDTIDNSTILPPSPPEPGGWIRPPKDWGYMVRGVPWTLVAWVLLTALVVLIGLALTKWTKSLAVTFMVLGFILGVFSFWPKGGYLDWWVLFPYVLVGWALLSRQKESPISE